MNKSAWLPMGLIALAALFVAGPVLVLPPGAWYGSHDGLRYPYLLQYFARAISAGVLYPRWLPELMGGYGYPTFVFYQPGYYYFSLPFTWVFDLLTACRASLVAMLLIAGMGAYRLARLFHPPLLSAALAVIYLFTPYISVEIFVRGDLSELQGMLLCPWSLYFGLCALRDHDSGKQAMRAGAGFVLTTAFLVVSHPFVAVFWLPAVLALAWVEGKQAAEKAILLVALVMVCSAPYWWTLLQLKSSVFYQGALMGGYSPEANFQGFFEVVGVPGFHLKFCYHAVAAIGFALAWQEGARWRIAAVCYAIGIFMMLPLSAPLWYLLWPVLKYIQFPWRIYSVLATLQLLAYIHLGFRFRQWHRRYPREMRLAAGIGAVWFLLLISGPFRLLTTTEGVIRWMLPEAITWPVFRHTEPLPAISFAPLMSERERREFVSLQMSGEFNPKTMNLHGLVNRQAKAIPPAEMNNGAGTVEVLPESTFQRLRLNVHMLRAGVLRINQFYFPGWRVEVNGDPVAWEDYAPGAPQGFIAANGRIGLRFQQPGDYRVEAWYEGPPGWRARNLLMLALAAVLIGRLHKLLAGSAPFAKTSSA
ncbi:MAG: hypothetical protein JO089_05715 [Alphaproteobacteria bacterium]|nr:hypothetical protein [Alphaproteobacteria bacterium]